MQRAIKTIPYQVAFKREMKRYQIIPMGMQERTQIKDEQNEEEPFQEPLEAED